MIGKTVSHYKILEKLGEGGMGVVYKAEDTRLRRTVALKFLSPHLTYDGEAKERFVHEAQAASALDHPNICAVHDIGETPEGQTFIVMAYYDGETLKKKIERGPFRIGEARDLAIQVAQGLFDAHQASIIHRDIKAANIFIAKSGVAKILDFGLAKLGSRTALTKAGSTLGTAAYMSPEQLRGDVVDARTDIWSLGAVFYEMLAGRRPFVAEYENALIYSILNSEPEPLTGVRSDVPMELERIVSKCLAKDREDRYQHVEELLSDLRREQKKQEHVKAGYLTASVHSPSPFRRELPKRRMVRIAIGASITLALIILIIIADPFNKDASQSELDSVAGKSIAVLPFVDMSPEKDQDYFCDGMTEAVIDRLSNIRGLKVPARTSVFTFKGKVFDIKEVGQKLQVRTALGGSVQKSGERLRITAELINVADGYHLWSGKYDRELKDVFSIQDEISAAIVDALQLKLTPQEERKLSEHPIENVKAYDCYLKAWHQILRFEEKSLDSAFANLQTAIDIMGDNAHLYSGMAAASAMYANIGMGQEEYLARAEEQAKKALDLKPDLPSALAQVGVLSIYRAYPENWHAYFRCMKKALSVNPSSAEVLFYVAGADAQTGRISEAHYYSDVFEEHDPLNPLRFVARGLSYEYGCQFELAAEQFHKLYQADAASLLAQVLYSSALASIGKREEALAVVNQVEAARNVHAVFCLLLKYALLKDRGKALHVMTPEFEKTCRRDFEWSYFVAARLSLLGARDEALDWLENAFSRGFINYPFMQCDPFLDNIRDEDRFKRVMVRAKYEWEHFQVLE